MPSSFAAAAWLLLSSYATLRSQSTGAGRHRSACTYVALAVAEENLVHNLACRNAMTSSEERPSAEAAGYRIERALMDCVAPLSKGSKGGDAIHQCPRADSWLLRGFVWIFDRPRFSPLLVI